jgi:hypothetical protein
MSGKPPRIGLQNGSAAFCNLGYVRVASIERPAARTGSSNSILGAVH